MELVWKDNFKDGRACNVGQGEAGAGSLVAKSSQPRPDVEIDFSWRALAWLAGTVAVGEPSRTKARTGGGGGG